MFRYSTLSFLACIFAVISCVRTQEGGETIKGNPPAEGFDIANSDPAAVELADSIVSSCGGRQAWEAIRFIQWKDGETQVMWDKLAGNIRIENGQNISILNLRTREGRTKVGTTEIQDTLQLSETLDEVYSVWSRSARKIFSPFLLKDKNVALKYFGEEVIDGKRCNVLEVVDTGTKPAIRYQLYVLLVDNKILRSDLFEPGKQVALESWSYGDYKMESAIDVSIPKGSSITDLVIGAEISENNFFEL